MLKVSVCTFAIIVMLYFICCPISGTQIREYLIKVIVDGELHDVIVAHNITEHEDIDTELISKSALRHCDDLGLVGMYS